MVSPLPKTCFEAKHLAKPLSFGPVFKSPFFDRSKDGARPGAAISSQDFFEARFEWPTLKDISLMYFTE
jgi:hypothetical protein